ncbi:MAG: hypothetical protein AAGI38_12220 [Bacteroidota bacterium]
MEKLKEIWNNKELRSGDFYELAIEVSNPQEVGSVKVLTNKLFELPHVRGPFDNDFEPTKLDLNYFDNLGYFIVDSRKVPFKTFHFPPEGENASSWLDILVDTSIYEAILGKEYQTWSSDAKWHKGLDSILIDSLKALNSVHQVRVGLIGWEVSGMYTLKTLREKQLEKVHFSPTKFFVNKDENLKGNNWSFISEL